ncbi:GAF domain-containing protein [Brevibacillus fluminis]|uniref:GAF domain-containing protein n=1 Tax=Brevibacillus fluminis TaxID=511487 RepID=A0A3M8DG21_9BACL|nr:AAA family ATPase [Brevibacillus fluminis]RNB87070.1 GAF domain-containing protein [Brevibacillus fluminis]
MTYTLGNSIEHCDDMTLEAMLANSGEWSLPDFLQLALQLAAIVGDSHRRRIVIRNLKPSTILINAQSMDMRVMHDGDAIVTESAMLETLPYLSPEMTGRLQRPVDHRTDLYSLGVIYYRIITGRFPYEAADAIEWTHAHLAKLPESAVSWRPALPPVIAAILERLLAKDPDERYQSAEGVRHDLARCQSMWQESGRIEPFALGQQDVSRLFAMLPQLYGREREIALLREAVLRASLGATELMLIVGPSGIGKTALIKQLQRSLFRENGYFISGKFEQFNRDIPYAPLIEAFRELIRQILTESEERTAWWKEKIKLALGQNAAVLGEVLPEITLLVGDVGQVEELSPSEAQRRFQLSFRHFIQVVTRKEHPLTLFLDDVQWADAATLQLIDSLLTDPGSQSLFVIGAWRESDVGDNHPLMLKMEEIRTAGVNVELLELGPLSLVELNRMVAETLRIEEKSAVPLSSLLYAKTAGNPFFFRQLFESLHDEGLLFFQPETGSWSWDVRAIESKQTTADLLDFMVDKIKRLPERAQAMLSLAACLGSRFHLELLSAVKQISIEELQQELDRAVQEGLIISDDGSSYSFLHDRIQQAAYSLLEPPRKQRFHYKVGTYLALQRSTGSYDVDIFELVSHLNAGVSLINEERERFELMAFNLEAGRKAKAASAFDTAAVYCRAGAELIRETDWAADFGLCFALLLERTECEYLCGHFEQAEKLAGGLSRRSRNRLERAAVCKVIATQYVNLGKYAEAISLGARLLAEFGIIIPVKPKQLDLFKELNLTKWHLRHQIDRLTELPDMQDVEQKMAMDLMLALAAPAFFSNKAVYVMLMSRSVRLTLKHGLSPISAAAFAGYGMALGLGMGDYETGYKLGRVALELVDRFNILSVKPKTYVMYGAVISRWLMHAEEGERYLEQGLLCGLEGGDYVFASYAMGALVNSFYVRKSIVELERRISAYMEILAETKDQFVSDNFVLYQQWIYALQGLTESPVSFVTKEFDEDAFMRQVQNTEFFATTLFQYYTYKTQLHYLQGEYEQAVQYANQAKPYMVYATHLPHLAECLFYHSLSIAGNMEKWNGWKRKRMTARLKANLRRFQDWAKHCAENYEHKVLLLEAELARLSQKDGMAMQMYEKAIRLAEAHGYVQNVAIASELAAHFYRQREIASSADFYSAKAYQFYRKWGATVKAERLLAEFPHSAQAEVAAAYESAPVALLSPGGPVASTSTSPREQAPVEKAAELDLATILKASHSVAEELDLGQLLSRLMKLIIENAGAQKGCVITEKAGAFQVEVEMGTDRAASVSAESSPMVAGETASESVLRYVWRTGSVMIAADAASDGLFAKDPYVIREKPRSILCAPIIISGEWKGVLYLENNLTTDAFSQERLKVLQMLAAQVIYVKNLLHSFGETTISVQTEPPTDDHQQSDLPQESMPTEQPSAQPLTEPLTERELEVLNLMAAGLSNKEIADQLVIAIGTVKTHVKNIFGKLNVNRRTKAVAEAKRYHLLNND